VPKQKTNSAAKKRFKVTGGSRLLRRHAMKSHNLEKKTAKRRRGFRRDVPTTDVDAKEVRRLLGL
jgi:large subunit ribosomal protein L35